MFKVFSCLIFVCFASKVYAGTQAQVGEQQLRHHLRLLSDAGLIKTPLNAWPLNWSNIIRELELAQNATISDALTWSIRYVSFEAKKQTQSSHIRLQNSNLSSAVPIADFSTQVRTEDEIGARLEFIVDRFAIDVEFNYISDPVDGDELRFDGSSVAFVVENWILGVGAIDRWWGPGWQSSLILSNNARPAPGVFLRRNYDDPFSIPFLALLGAWQFEFFVNQLEEERSVADARLGGARLSFKPFSNFEWGYSTTQLFDAENDLHELSTGWSQNLTAIDFRGGVRFGRFTHGLYAQLTGPTQSGVSFEDSIGLAGYDLAFNIGESSHRLVVEYANSLAGFLNEEQFGQAYEDDIFQSGYRFNGRNIGNSLGGDTESLALIGLHYFYHGWDLEWKANFFSREQIAGEDVSNNFYQLRLGKILNENLKALVSVYGFSNPFLLEEGDMISEGGGVSLIYRF